MPLASVGSFLCSNPFVLSACNGRDKDGGHIRVTARLLPGYIVKTLAGHHRER